MFCQKCGAENVEDARFCNSCGASFVSGGEESKNAGSGPDQNTESKATGTGLDQNIAALLSYVVGWVTGIVFYIIEKENNYVRFHAMQSIVVFGAFTVVQIILNILSIIPAIGVLFWIMSILVSVAGFVLWVVLMLKAYQGEMYKVPWAGDYAEKMIAGQS